MLCSIRFIFITRPALLPSDIKPTPSSTSLFCPHRPFTWVYLQLFSLVTMGRRRKPNKKSGESSTLTPPPEEGDVEVDNVEVPTNAEATEPVQTTKSQSKPPATTNAAPQDEAVTSAAAPAVTETAAAAPETAALPAPAPPSKNVHTGPTHEEKAATAPSAPVPAPVLARPTSATTTASADTPAAPTPLDGVAALNAFALLNASGDADGTKVVDSTREDAAEHSQPPPDSAAVVPSEAPVHPPHSSTKKVGFVTPVVSSITSVSDTETPREANCVEARCGSCAVM